MAKELDTLSAASRDREFSFGRGMAQSLDISSKSLSAKCDRFLGGFFSAVCLALPFLGANLRAESGRNISGN